MVPTARRMLLTDRRRAVLGMLGVAVALVMAMTLDGIFVGSTRQVSRYIDTSPADPASALVTATWVATGSTEVETGR